MPSFPREAMLSLCFPVSLWRIFTPQINFEVSFYKVSPKDGDFTREARWMLNLDDLQRLNQPSAKEIWPTIEHCMYYYLDSKVFGELPWPNCENIWQNGFEI